MATIPARPARRPVAATLAMRKAHLEGQGMFDINNDGDLVILGNDWSDLDPTAPTRLCRSCGRILPIHCYHRTGTMTGNNLIAQTRYKPDCIICSDDHRIATHMQTAWPVKARMALESHMKRERDQGLHTCTTLTAYMQLTGVTVEWLATHMRTLYLNNDKCHHCESVGHQAEWQTICRIGGDGKIDLHDMTLDRLDRTRLLSRQNMQVTCRYGNISKPDDPHVADVQLAYWRRHNATR